MLGTGLFEKRTELTREAEPNKIWVDSNSCVARAFDLRRRHLVRFGVKNSTGLSYARHCYKNKQIALRLKTKRVPAVNKKLRPGCKQINDYVLVGNKQARLGWRRVSNRAPVRVINVLLWLRNFNCGANQRRLVSC